MPQCSQEVTLKSLRMVEEDDITCPKQVQACVQTKFSVAVDKSVDNDNSLFVVTYGDPMVERHSGFISYDQWSLIGEVGGVLGLTLGVSGLSILQNLTRTISRFIVSRTCMK